MAAQLRPPMGPSIASSSSASSSTVRRPNPPKRRARTMSFSIRTTDERSGSKSKKLVIALLVILSLFLIGTVIVLSSVSYYFGIPSSAFLTELEVKWRPGDTIKPLKYSPELSAKAHKRALYSDTDIITEATAVNDEDDVWDVDGKGSGGYWMRKDWDGQIEGIHDWQRLNNVTTRPGETIPRLIHQTWKDGKLPEKWRKSFKECREGMPDYEYMLWTDEAALAFVRTHYPHHLHMFESYKYPIMRADAIRYFVLHHFGGIYMDLDIGCRRRLDPLLQGDWDTILPVTKPVGVSNDLMFSAKGAAFMDHTIHALPAWDHDWFMNYPTVMFSTGPMFVSGQYAIYSAAHPITESFPRSEVRVLPKSLYGKNIAAELVPHSFFAHYYGSSWHAEDAGFVWFLGTWGKKLMWVGLAVLVFGVVRVIYLKTTSTSQEYFVSILPTHSGASTPTGSHSTSASMEALQTELSNDIAGALRRAGNLILAVPAILSGDRRNNRRRQGLLYFVPALFQPARTRRNRTASEASQMPLRRTRRDRERAKERESLIEASGSGSASGSPPPPPYATTAEEPARCSSPEPLSGKSDEETEDGYLRSEGSSSEYDNVEWEWKETR